MEYGLLGPLQVFDSDRAIALGSSQQRKVLAILLLDANRAVSLDRLVEAVWGQQPPRSAAAVLKNRISQLRKLLASADLRTEPSGYLLHVEPDDLDSRRFERLARNGRQELAAGRPSGAARVLAEALALWRGPALADFAYDEFAQTEIARLEELRVATLEDRFEADLASGRAAELVPELEAAVHNHPLRERLRGELMLALYRSGRQAEALETYEAARQGLVEELGIDPSPELRRLNKQILNQDSSLRAPDRSGQDLPHGTVTLMATDVEGSTRILRRLGTDTYARVLDEHRRLLRSAVRQAGGRELDEQGDSFLFVFESVGDALTAATRAQQELAAAQWPPAGELRIRIALHSGEPAQAGGRYFGLDVHRVARICAAGHGGQILISRSTRELAGDGLPLRDLGEHRFKDLPGAERIYQLGDDDYPSLTTLDTTNLPAASNRFVGRKRELTETVQALRRDDVRLLTLTGPPGTGKTRLALEAAANLVGDFGQGVYFVSLAAITDPNLVMPTVARTLSVREVVGEELLDTLVADLSDKTILLLLDNFEQVVEGATSVASLMASAKRLKILVTSRTPLRISPERTYDVPPLDLPDVFHLPETGALARCESVALFIERVQAAKSSFALTDENASTVAEICVRLDGLPLALELAAARIRALPPHALLGRLDQRLDLLVGGAQDLDERQRTLRATIAWSYDLLSKKEKAFFARLAVFVGGCRIEAAEAVCGVGGEDRLDVLNGLTSLVEKNLLRQRTDPDGEPRFWMLETIRQYARERLEEANLVEPVASAHAGFYGRLAEEESALLHGSEEAAASARLELERENLRAALHWLRERRGDARFLALAADLGQFWALRAELREGREWLDAALGDEGGDPRTRERALKCDFWIAYYQGDLVRAKDIARQRARNAEVLCDDRAVQGSLSSLAHVAEMEGDDRRARELQEQSLEAARRSGDKRAVSAASTNLAHFAERCGDEESARATHEEALAIDRELAESGDIARDLSNLGWVAVRQGRFFDAEALYRDALVIVEELGYRTVLADILGGLASVAVNRGDFVRAGRLAGAEEMLVASNEVVLDSYWRDIRERYFLAPLRTQEKNSEVAAAWAEGRRMTTEQVAPLVLKEEPLLSPLQTGRS